MVVFLIWCQLEIGVLLFRVRVRVESTDERGFISHHLTCTFSCSRALTLLRIAHCPSYACRSSADPTSCDELQAQQLLVRELAHRLTHRRVLRS